MRLFPTYWQLAMEESEDHWVGEVGHHCVHQGDADHLVTQDVAAVFILLEKKGRQWQCGKGELSEEKCARVPKKVSTSSLSSF